VTCVGAYCTQATGSQCLCSHSTIQILAAGFSTNSPVFRIDVLSRAQVVEGRKVVRDFCEQAHVAVVFAF